MSIDIELEVWFVKNWWCKRSAQCDSIRLCFKHAVQEAMKGADIEIEVSEVDHEYGHKSCGICTGEMENDELTS